MSFLNVYASNIVNTTQCVRAMALNPVSCHKGSGVNFTAGEPGPITVTSDYESGSVISYSKANDPVIDGLMAKQICARG